MKEEKNHIEYSLIGKYLEGIASPEENMEVEEWINQSQKNRAEFQHIKRIWELAESGIPGGEAPVNTERAWEKLKGRIVEKNSRDRIVPDSSIDQARTRNITYYVLRVAAVIVVVLAFYTLYINYIKGPDLIEVLAENGIRETVLPDESSVTLNENSAITFPERFVKDKRVVELKGEAFFEVKRDDDKPFIIRVPEAVIEVLGTSFNVRAIEADPEVVVTVQEGKVMLSDKENIAYIVLEKYEKGVLNKESGHIEKYVATDESEMFWKTRTLIFRDTQLSKVFEVLEKLYDVKIKILNDEIKKCLLTAKFQDQEIEEIMANIAINFDLEIQQDGSSIEISGDGC